jgi:hypothetical protein
LVALIEKERNPVAGRADKEILRQRKSQRLRGNEKSRVRMAMALEEFKEAKEALEGLRDEQRGYFEERSRQNTAEDIILQSLKLERPVLRQSTKDAVKAAAKKDPAGNCLDANTGEVIQGEPVYGHKYGREHRRLV